jgi:hypothetical protein
LISISIPTFEKNRAKSALVSDLPKTSNNNIKPFFHPRIEFYFSLKNKIIQFEIHFYFSSAGGKQGNLGPWDDEKSQLGRHL